jgi:hypothetical protein
MRFLGLVLISLALCSPSMASDDRDVYASKLERIFLSSGVNLSVYNRKKTNTLLVYGPMDKATVSIILTRTDILGVARDIKFGKVEFSCSGCPVWVFDVSKETISRCSTGAPLCI